MKTLPYEKIKQKLLNLSDQLWDEEERELKRILEKLPDDERIIQVSYTHVIDCSTEPIAVKTKISFSEKFSATASGSIEDPAQMTLMDNLAKEMSAKTTSPKA